MYYFDRLERRRGGLRVERPFFKAFFVKEKKIWLDIFHSKMDNIICKNNSFKRVAVPLHLTV